jgi:alkylated DNA nucleotide flippase Atl1
MAMYGGPMPWWRVVRADGTPPECHEGEAVQHHRAEGTPFLRSGRLDMSHAFWQPT